jgi:hypothetical protein
MVHFKLDDVTNKELKKVAKKSGMPKSELVRFAVNEMFNPEWKRIGKEFQERLGESFCLETSGGGRSERP